MNKGITIVLTDERENAEDGNFKSETFFSERGLSEFVEFLDGNRERLIEKVVAVEGEKDNIPVEVAMIYNTSYSENIHSYVNNINTHEGGTHLTGFRRGLTSTLKKYAEESGMLQKLKFDIAGDDWLSDPYALQTLVDELDQNPSYSFVDSGFDCYYQRTGKIKSFINKNIVTSSKEEYINRHKIFGTSFMGCCYRKSSIEKYVDFDEYRNQQIDFEDYPILTDLMMNSDFGLIPKALSVYRKHRDSHSHKADSYL